MKKLLLFISILTFSISWSEILSPKIYLVLLAGGSGERLWPLSKRDKPKQFLSLNGSQTMLEDTIDRLKYIPGNTSLWAVTTRELEPLVKKSGGDDLKRIIVEPERRDTGPAFLLTCLKIVKADPRAIVVFIPTDHFIPDLKKFAEILSQAIEHAVLSNDITLLGITPTHPATNYGYISFDEKKIKNNTAPLIFFHEKPDEKKAKEIFKKENVLWNSGIYCGKVRCFIKAFKKYARNIYKATNAYLKKTGSYGANPKISVDYAITEKYPHRAVTLANFPWSDTGDLKTFLSKIQKKPLNQVITVEAYNNLIYSKKKVVGIIGLSNLCVVETDNEILIVPQQKLQLIRSLLTKLKEKHPTSV